MSKAHRGAGIRTTVNHSRGTCPVCKRTGIKVMYEHQIGEQKVTICKQCRATVSRTKKKAAATAEA
ncbi:MAG TPA: hypothetical protein VMW87_01195 [Spirochaetia bacterium]|nr:hypothetical protein [Spirochaetia bacterium]